MRPGSPFPNYEGIIVDISVNKADPPQISMLVLSPAAFLLISRSAPMTAPHRNAF